MLSETVIQVCDSTSTRSVFLIIWNINLVCCVRLLPSKSMRYFSVRLACGWDIFHTRRYILHLMVGSFVTDCRRLQLIMNHRSAQQPSYQKRKTVHCNENSARDTAIFIAHGRLPIAHCNYYHYSLVDNKNELTTPEI